MAECIGVPASKYICAIINTGEQLSRFTEKFETRDLAWAPDGKGLVLLDKDTFCCAFEVEEEAEAS